MSSTFKGGIHPHDFKELSRNKPIEKMNPPVMVVIPLSQHIGAPCEPLVAVGDEVTVGQKIGDSGAPVSAPVHASVSGKVVAIEPRLTTSGVKVNSIVIENDFNETICPDVKPHGTVESLSKEEIIDICREAGLVGMGGATFPTATKIRSCLEKEIDYVIVNAAECEPYLTADNAAMLATPERVLGGLRALLKVFGVSKGYIGVEDNKPEAIESLKKAVGSASDIEVCPLPTKYPQGGEKQIIYSITGREVPSGKLPAEVGAAVFNLGTCMALYDAITTGMPSIERIVTVTGQGIQNPKNVLAKVGTSFADMIEFCGGLKDNVSKVISGGPMMGAAQFSTEVPVIKGTSGILVLTTAEDKTVGDPVCIRCGKCVEACPMGLLPNYMYLYGGQMRLEEAAELNVLDCIECGACTYGCPGRLHLVQTFRATKLRIQEERRKERERAKANEK